MATESDTIRLGESSVWHCYKCKARRPNAPAEESQFVNETGVCPRCVAREMAKEEK